MLKDVVSAYRPESYFLKTGASYPTDKIGDPYIPLSSEVTTPLPFDPNRPGKGIMIHFMNQHNRNTVISQIKQQGFLSPRQFATFSTGPMDWVIDPSVSALVFRSYSRWSREYGNDGYTPWVEGLIGLPQTQAADISPQAVQYHKRIRGNRGYLGWDVWSYVPPTHLLGVINFSGKSQAKAFEKLNHQLKEEYEEGSITEHAVAKAMQESRKDIPIEQLTGNISEDEREEFWASYAGALTEDALLWAILRDRDKYKVARMQCSYPWTKQVQQEALNPLE